MIARMPSITRCGLRGWDGVVVRTETRLIFFTDQRDAEGLIAHLATGRSADSYRSAS